MVGLVRAEEGKKEAGKEDPQPWGSVVAMMNVPPRRIGFILAREND
jgi:hypothetical protein